MYPTKAHGLNGMYALFFQIFWHIIGDDVSNSILTILNNKASPEQFNQTFIALIPKIQDLTTPKDFRRISLCNAIFKIVTKTIANRLKVVLPFLIHETQSSFVPSKQF